MVNLIVKKRNYRNVTTAVLTTLFILISYISIFAAPRITNVTMVPPNPGFGDAVSITIDYCGNKYVAITGAVAVSTSPTRLNAQLSGTGQVFLVSSAGVGVPTPNFPPGGMIHVIVRASDNTLPDDCTQCPSSSGSSGSVTYNVNMPNADDFPGCNISDLYLHVFFSDSNLNESKWDDASTVCAPDADTYVSAPWSIPVPNADFTIHKRAEGVLQDVGDLLLYSIDFEYGNGPLTITDVIPTPPSGQFTLESIGPVSMVTSAPAVGSVVGGQTITWTIPDRTGVPGKAYGTVWFLLRMTGDIPDGTNISNTATGNMPAAGNKTSTANITVGEAVVTLTKSQEAATVDYGDNVTYYLQYEVNGSKLVAYEPFDDITAGTYNAGTGAPPGWKYLPEGGESGTWQIYDECGTGDYIIRGTSPLNKYPGMTLTSPEFCTGIIVTDVLIDAVYEGADALVIIRNNNISGTGSVAYALVVSVDNNPGKLSFQKCADPGGCSWNANYNATTILTNTWYRVKVEAVTECSFQAKIWKKGDPEPAGWMTSWTDGSCVSCGNGDTWTPGIAEQGGATGETHDVYNNFMVYEPRTSLNTYMYDTVPTGVIYGGSSTAPSSTSPYLNWNLGNLSNEGGTYTWWGQVDQCDPITNKGTINGTGINATDSNEVVTIPVCPTPVITLDKTFTPAGPVGPGDAVTWSLEVCNSAAGPTANPIYVWDTIPTEMNWGGWVGAPGSGTTAPGGLIQWDVAPLTASQCKTVQWWGTVQ